jgi:hypothetical protein
MGPRPADLLAEQHRAGRSTVSPRHRYCGPEEVSLMEVKTSPASALCAAADRNVTIFAGRSGLRIDQDQGISRGSRPK